MLDPLFLLLPFHLRDPFRDLESFVVYNDYRIWLIILGAGDVILKKSVHVLHFLCFITSRKPQNKIQTLVPSKDVKMRNIKQGG